MGLPIKPTIRYARNVMDEFGFSLIMETLIWIGKAFYKSVIWFLRLVTK